MAQRLILPINKALFRIGSYSNAFTARHNKTHYGWTFEAMDGESKNVWASGNGKVVKKGWDTHFGNVVIIQYDDCQLDNYSTSKSVVIRYYHLGSVSVSENQTVTKDTKIGVAGNTGSYVREQLVGLYIEIDTDTKYPEYSPLLTKSMTAGGVIKPGYEDTLVTPVYALSCKTTAPDYQAFNRGPQIDSYTNKYWYSTSQYNLMKFI